MTPLAVIVLSFAGFLAGGLGFLLLAVGLADLLSDRIFAPPPKYKASP
jgi:hypothetical protein